ncbi:aminotransferase class I/II-fold pyridoxal phosphate-dependent enzyme [Paracidovorax avenae]|uniref:aminotransferase class I/II-fold pyridoxal phosphate-dependent enzyme n=1 Tax=Paracidovorax avenae TaxID=80867 RepID=UPI000D21804F|nr:aminotransferase class I/II-fold pyridoxal phosphate-dependent enzyme [Paracidovorax avenae]AVS84548.1 aminotransferase [Paracidovorax avenae]AVS95567.1 aminotransferase [Paracidovorax avenae]AVT02237.1 aminotransferase [Paracidovorax avenae]AVT09146.1 aminotransferase [Paracidovorax avenae]
MTRQALDGGAAAQGLPVHGGPDALGVPLHDFSTNANACGPCPAALVAVRGADAARYPDPAYTALREALGAWHGVAPGRILPAASASEFIHRFTAWAARQGVAGVAVPAHAYGDYARAARAWGLPLLASPGPGAGAGAEEDSGKAVLHWACEPGSPLGTSDPGLEAWHARAAIDSGTPDADLRIVDCAYAPLRLEAAGGALPANAWQLWTPNKALGLTGVRAAYAIAPACVPRQCLDALQALAPSWPIGAHGVAMLSAWVAPQVQDWLAASLDTLRAWKAAQQALCEGMGWAVQAGSRANYFVARPPVADLPRWLQALRLQGVKLRDCGSFGLPGCVRLGVLPPASQQALQAAWQAARPATAA